MAWPSIIVAFTIAGAIYKTGEHFGKFFATKEGVRKAESVCSEMASDKKVKLAEAIAIAQGYTKAKKSF